MLLKVAITGQPGSGKSLVTKLFNRKEDVFTLSADRLAHTVMSVNSNIIKDMFGIPQKVSYKMLVHILRKEVFVNDDMLKKLEEYIHPRVFSLMESQFEIYENTLTHGDHLIVVEVPLLYECGWEKYFDKVVLVKTADYEQIARLEILREWEKTEINNRIKRFIPDNNKIDMVDYIIDTTCLLCDLELQVDDLYVNLSLDLEEKSESNNPR